MLEQLENAGRRFFGINEIFKPNKKRLRSCYRYVRNKLFTPSWVHHPSNIQLDTHNYCNLWQCGNGCVHCNVKPGGGWNLKRGFMNTGLIEYLIDYWGKHGASSVAPYINGEPLMDPRLPYICKLTEKAGMRTVIDTNGTLTQRRENLVHRNLIEVRFSFSAATPETYRKVHGAPLFCEVTKNVEWFLENKFPNQYPMLYFITNKYNIEEIPEFLDRWRGKCHIVFFPLHEVKGVQTESEKTRPEGNYWDQITYMLTNRYPTQPNRPIDVPLNGFAETRYFPFYETCQGTHSFSVNWQGKILHCTDIPYHFNYGDVYAHHNLLKVWVTRNVMKMYHPACKACNVKHPRHDEILRKYL